MKRAFTLIELLLYLALLAIILGAAFVLFFSLIDGLHRSRSRVLLLHEGTFVLNTIQNILHEGDLVLPAADESFTRFRVERETHSLEIDEHLFLSRGNTREALLSDNVRVSDIDFRREQNRLHVKFVLEARTPQGRIVEMLFHRQYDIW